MKIERTYEVKVELSLEFLRSGGFMGSWRHYWETSRNVMERLSDERICNFKVLCRGSDRVPLAVVRKEITMASDSIALHPEFT